MSKSIERVSDSSFLITFAEDMGEIIDAFGNPAPPSVQSIFDRYNIQVPEQMEVSLEIEFYFSGDEIIPESGEIIVMHETENGINPVSAGVILTAQELNLVVEEYADSIRDTFHDVQEPQQEDYRDYRDEML